MAGDFDQWNWFLFPKDDWIIIQQNLMAALVFFAIIKLGNTYLKEIAIFIWDISNDARLVMIFF